MTVGMSAPPIGMISSTPNTSDKPDDQPGTGSGAPGLTISQITASSSAQTEDAPG